MREMNEGQALVFDIYRGTIHDGPGMRTTIFMKGCPLHCRWCHNPEGMSWENAVTYERKKCLGCRLCSAQAGRDIVTIEDGQPKLAAKHTEIPERSVAVCPGGALRREAQTYLPDELCRKVSSDKTFFESFGGGVTISGGEPAMQFQTVAAILRRLKEMGIHTALDTCGYADWTAYKTMLPYVDLVLFDVKVSDSMAHKRLVGVHNDVILENLHKILAYKREEKPDISVWIRTPLIPGDTATEENISAIGEILTKAGAEDIARWELCAFNNICSSKYEKQGKNWYYADVPLMTDAEVQKMVSAGCKTFCADKIVHSGFTRKA